MDITIFKRYEIKYLVSAEQRQILENAFTGKMIPDEHGKSTICNVYCDTPDYRLIRTSLEKPVYKEKFRIRSYGRAAEEGKVFMELKKKYDGIVYKRRISLKQSEAAAYIAGTAQLPEDGQIEREMDYFVQFYGGLVPAMYLCYDRTAFFSVNDPGLRVTFDENILWRTDRVRLTSHPNGRQLLKPGQSLMEIKCGEAMPLELVRLLNANSIRPLSFSKYGSAYKTMIAERPAEKNTSERGVYCA